MPVGVEARPMHGQCGLLRGSVWRVHSETVPTTETVVVYQAVAQAPTPCKLLPSTHEHLGVLVRLRRQRGGGWGWVGVQGVSAAHTVSYSILFIRSAKLTAG